jgi:hypothetical protein
MRVGGQRHAPTALPPGKTRYPLYRRLGGHQGRSGQVRKISPPSGFNPRTIQTITWNRKLFLLQIKKRNFGFFARSEFTLGYVGCSNEHWHLWHSKQKFKIIKMRYQITERRNLSSSFNLLKVNFLWVKICTTKFCTIKICTIKICTIKICTIVTHHFIIHYPYGTRWPKLLMSNLPLYS